MPFISYAQNFEDVMLWRALSHVENGFYIDVGANDPIIDSVTKAFYDKGWQGINIEPVESHFYDLEKSRPRDINLNIGASNFDGETEIIIPSTRGWASINDDMIKKYQAEDEQAQTSIICVRSLDRIWHECCENSEVHFLKIDVENYEKTVLEGLTLSVHRPWIILVESTLPNSQVENNQAWEDLLTTQAYDMVYFDGLNRFFCAHEHSELKIHFTRPPNVFDDFIHYREYCLHQQLQEIKTILNVK